MRQLITLFLFLLSNTYLFSQNKDSIRIHGYATDFENTPLDSVAVRLKNKKFENLYETITNKNGYYSLTVPKGEYYCIYAIKLSDYGITKLEYWAWNIPAFNDLEINPKYERMEIYGINAFEPQVGPHDTYMVYFRPMSLTKSLEFKGKSSIKEKEQQAINKKDTIDIAPKSISKDELKVYINDSLSEIIAINKMPEYARGTYLYGYLVQIRKVGNKNPDSDYDKISITLHSKETNERGLGEHFVKKVK